MSELLTRLSVSLQAYRSRTAFCLGETSYTYTQFIAEISRIRQVLKQGDIAGQSIIGIAANDDVATYAAIIAVWLEGKAYVPLNPTVPEERNMNVIDQAGIRTIIGGIGGGYAARCAVIEIDSLPEARTDIDPKPIGEDTLAYILFTSGTTGIPKGVPITHGNLEGFIRAFDALGVGISEEDRCLQMFELTFDLSVFSYLVPLLNGASVYLIPGDRIKYGYIYTLMDEAEISFALMVPSILHYLRPYFDEMNFPKMRYSLFCGEALSLDVTEEWAQCVPNATIMNVYGPTEDTIFCTHYRYDRQDGNKAYNGILSIGRPLRGTDIIVVDEKNRELQPGQTGEVCLGGVQLTPGYWQNEEKNREAFFYKEAERFYKTGDIGKMDEAGDLLYLGRLDSQVKVQGFRVELSEIEYHSKEHIGRHHVAAIAFENQIGNTEIGLAIEAQPFDTDALLDYLKSKLPVYMLPTKFHFELSFPLNVNGKTDRKMLKKYFEQ
jgi:amino acid adenylation domain-containing protein